MALYLKTAFFVNRAPFENLKLDLLENGINVLSAINGKGKTTILSHITDAFYELAKKTFHNEFEGKENKYYRISSPLYNIDFSSPSFVYLRFKLDEDDIDYIDIRNNCTEEQYNAAIQIDSKIPFFQLKRTIEDRTNIKYWSINDKKKIENIFNSSILTYFPSYRYETPAYLNDPYNIKLDFTITSKFAGKLTNPIEVISDLPMLVNWFLDVLLDMKLNEERPSDVLNAEKIYVWNNLNKIISNTLSSKGYNGTVRLGIGKRAQGGTRVAIANDREGGSYIIAPSIFNLSSGELSLISIFGEILHQADNKSNVQLNQINGMVLIDEIDKHLHISLQKEILPKLLNLFPNIQFVVSSHSPFFSMGLADDAIDRTRIIDLDNNAIICEPTSNVLYKEVYEMMVNENHRFAKKYEALQDKVRTLNKPIIITEGKTDWKHLKAALSYFKNNHEFENIDVEIIEYDFDFGDSKLHGLLNQYKTFAHRYKIIGIFDCDEANGSSIHKLGGVKKYGENIYGMTIPIPNYREYHENGISIEFLYQDEDLKLMDKDGRRLYTTSEFNENGRLKSNPEIGVKNNHDVKKYINPANEKIQADEVIDITGRTLALSKEAFATNILEKTEEFSNVNFDAFRQVFERLQKILQEE